MVKNGEVRGNNVLQQLKESSWRQRTKFEKRLIIASIISSIVLLVTFIVYMAFLNKPKICTSSACVRTSMELLHHIDTRVDPCEDFYRFSCGSFLQNTKLESHSSRSVQDILQDEIQLQIRSMLEQPLQFDDPQAFNLAKKFYRACMNESAVEAEGLRGIKEIFRQIGGWPTLDGSNWRDSQFDWKDVVHKLREIGISFEFFLILAVQTDKDSTRYVLNLQDPVYVPSKLNINEEAMYLDYMVDIAVLFGASKERARREQNEVLQFHLALAQISNEARTANETRPQNRMNPSELEYQFPSVQWLDYINKILRPAAQITPDDVIYVPEPGYVKRLLNLLIITSKRTVANFMVWHTLQHLNNYLPHKISDRAYKYLADINVKPVQKPVRWEMCLKNTEERLKSVVSAAYVAQYIDGDVKSLVMDMVRNIKRQFKYNLHDLDWLDERTKKMAVNVLVTSVEDIVSYDDSLRGNTVYDEVDIVETKLLTSTLKLDYVNANEEYALLGHNVDSSNMHRQEKFVTNLGITYLPKENKLKFPMGLMQSVYYQKDRPQYMNYGALGSIIAHEISHIFIEAEYRDLKGELRSWWSSHSLLNYDKKLQCLSNQYSKFAVPTQTEQIPMKYNPWLNTSSTFDENLADLAGMKVSYDTYVNWVHENGVEPQLPGLNYSPKQLFWISSAIHQCSKYSAETLQMYNANYPVHSSRQFRANGALQNLEEFAIDFGCAVDSRMNPMEKCTIW